MGAGQRRVDRQRFRRRLHRALQVELVVEDDGQVVQADRVVRRQRHGPARRRLRLVQPPERAVHLADIAQIERRVGAVPQRPFHPVQRLGEALAAERDDAAEMQRVRLVRHRRQDLPDQPLGIVQPPGVLVLRGDSEQLAHRH